MGEAILNTPSELKLLYQSIPNFERMITSVKQRELPNFVAIGSTIQLQILGFFPTFSSSCFVNSPTDSNSQRILTYMMAQKTWFGVRMCLLCV